MAEVETNVEAGEVAQKFIELVMMMAQNAAYSLGQIPHPETGEAPVNLDMARIFIDQLVVLRTKTRNNLGPDEQAILNNTISNLQMVFLEVSQPGSVSAGAAIEHDEEEAAAPEVAAPEAAAEAPKIEEPAEEESKKKFSKSYGS